MSVPVLNEHELRTLDMVAEGLNYEAIGKREGLTAQAIMQRVKRLRKRVGVVGDLGDWLAANGWEVSEEKQDRRYATGYRRRKGERWG